MGTVTQLHPRRTEPPADEAAEIAQNLYRANPKIAERVAVELLVLMEAAPS
jgi:hypothetical protein